MIISASSSFPGAKFEWDEEKAAENLRKHGVSFDEAKTVFQDPGLVIVDDEAHSAYEERFVAIGYSDRHSILFVVHTSTEIYNYERVRIISARPADKTERGVYEGSN